MPRINFDPDKIDWRPFFTEPQVGGAYFQGKPYMRGTGIGALFSSLYRFLLPIAKSIGKEVGREGLAVGSRILGDVAKGENPKAVISSHSREGVRNLIAKANDKLNQSGSGQTKKVSSKKNPIKKQKGRGAVVHTFKPVLPKSKKRRASAYSGLFEGRRIADYSPPNKKRKGKKRKRRQQFDSLGPY